jgi:hypothetical protein
MMLNVFIACIGISNSMASSAICANLEKNVHERVFQRLSKLQEFEGRVQFEVFEKFTSACFFQIARETIPLFIINIHEKIIQSN